MVWRIITLVLICYALLTASGCETGEYYTYQDISPRPRTYQRPLKTYEPPPVGYSYDKTLYLIIEPDEPNGAKVYKVKYRNSPGGHQVKVGGLIGETPLKIPIKFCEWDGLHWYKGCDLDDDVFWSPSTDGKTHILRYYLEHANYYPMFVNTYISFEDQAGKKLSLDSGGKALIDGCTIWPYKSWESLIEHGSLFSKKIGSAINHDDYYKAEELRLRRIEKLKGLLKEDDEYWRKIDFQYCRSIDTINRKLVESELNQLEHLVGLLDGQLMSFRKQLLAKLNEGDVETALQLAKMVTSMEEKYFPKPSPVIVRQVVQQPPQQVHIYQQEGGKQTQPQKVIVQQKPYYGATDIVKALSAIRGDKVDPQQLREAYGWATLSDLLGFGEMLNK